MIRLALGVLAVGVVALLVSSGKAAEPSQEEKNKKFFAEQGYSDGYFAGLEANQSGALYDSTEPYPDGGMSPELVAIYQENYVEGYEQGWKSA
jgi:hypothetical protein